MSSEQVLESVPLARPLTVNRSKLCAAIGILLCLLTVLAVSKHPRYTWDELYHFKVFKRLQQYGYTPEFLRDMGVATGPLFSFMCDGLYRISPPLSSYKMRLINVFFLFVLLLALVYSLKKIKAPPIAAFQVLGIPLVPLMAGMGMTDMVALGLFHLHLLCVLQVFSLDDEGYSKQALKWGLVAGLILGLSIVTRQIFLLTCVTAAALLFRKQSLRFLVPYALAAAPLPAILFAIWGGLTPPGENYTKQHFSFLCLSVALSHSALLFAIFDVRYLTVHKKRTFLCLVLGLVLSPLMAKLGWIDLGDTVPFWGRAKGRLSETGFYLYRYGFSGLTLGLSFPFVIYLWKRFREQKALVAQYLFGIAGLLLITPGFVTHNYSSRYVLSAFPTLLLLHTRFFPKDTIWKAVRILLGGVFGILVMRQYSSELPYEKVREFFDGVSRIVGWW